MRTHLRCLNLEPFRRGGFACSQSVPLAALWGSLPLSARLRAELINAADHVFGVRWCYLSAAC